MILNRTVKPTEKLISVADAKQHLRVDFPEDEDLIAGMIDAVNDALDGPHGIVGKALLTQTWKMDLRAVSGDDAVKLPVLPLQTVSAMTYFDGDNAQQSLTVGDFRVYKTEDQAWIEPDENTNWPTMYDRPDALSITMVGGFGTAADVPGNVRVAALQMLAQMYEHRGDGGGKMPDSAKDLAGLSRVGWFG